MYGRVVVMSTCVRLGSMSLGAGVGVLSVRIQKFGKFKIMGIRVRGVRHILTY